MKITRGRYALPITSRFGTRPPAPEVVIAQLNREGAQQLVSSGAAAANALGLTTQVPVQQTFLARTRSQKRYTFGKQQVTIRPAAAWNFLLLPDRPAGQAIRALPWLGPDQASAAIPTLLRVLPPVELLNDANGCAGALKPPSPQSGTSQLNLLNDP